MNGWQEVHYSDWTFGCTVSVCMNQQHSSCTPNKTGTNCPGLVWLSDSIDYTLQERLYNSRYIMQCGVHLRQLQPDRVPKSIYWKARVRGISVGAGGPIPAPGIQLVWTWSMSLLLLIPFPLLLPCWYFCYCSSNRSNWTKMSTSLNSFSFVLRWRPCSCLLSIYSNIQ